MNIRHDYPDGGHTTVTFQNPKDRDRYLAETAKRETAPSAWREHWYRCGGDPGAGCGRWFGADYLDPYTGETLQHHDCNGTQLALFALEPVS